MNYTPTGNDPLELKIIVVGYEGKEILFFCFLF